jgi:hypothetical protein
VVFGRSFVTVVDSFASLLYLVQAMQAVKARAIQLGLVLKVRLVFYAILITIALALMFASNLGELFRLFAAARGAVFA